MPPAAVDTGDPCGSLAPDTATGGDAVKTEWVVRDVTDLLVELGLTSTATVARVVPAEALDASLDYYGAPDGVAVVELLVELGVGVAVHTDDVDDVTEAYPTTLQEIAACTDGLFTITDVTVTEPYAISARTVRFRSNGTPVEWIVDDHGPDYLDAQTFFERIDDFTDSADARRWADIEVGGTPLPDRYLFGHPQALRRLAETFDFTVDIRGLPAD
jgi:hypothetical protein